MIFCGTRLDTTRGARNRFRHSFFLFFYFRLVDGVWWFLFPPSRLCDGDNNNITILYG